MAAYGTIPQAPTGCVGTHRAKCLRDNNRAVGFPGSLLVREVALWLQLGNEMRQLRLHGSRYTQPPERGLDNSHSRALYGCLPWPCSDAAVLHRHRCGEATPQADRGVGYRPPARCSILRTAMTDTRIVTTTYRYKPPPRKRKAVAITGPAIVRKRGRADAAVPPPDEPEPAPPPPANDDRRPPPPPAAKSAIVTTTSRKRAKLERAERVAEPDDDPEADGPGAGIPRSRDLPSWPVSFIRGLIEALTRQQEAPRKLEAGK